MDRDESQIGVDVGATLAKIARQQAGASRARSFDLMPSADLEAVAKHILSLRPARVGATGGGAARLAALLPCPCERVNEFEAWGAGAATLLSTPGGVERDITGPGPAESFLLVSLGTGTSVLHVQGRTTSRVGGTALGGGTVVGLGGALTGASFEELCDLAQRGAAASVDLRVSDIYGPDEIPLAGDLTAANFGKLAHELNGTRAPNGSQDAEKRRADLAAAVMRMVGENVALICAGLAAATTTTKIVYAGSTIRGNESLRAVLTEVTILCGRQPIHLESGEFAGALGALELTRK